MVKEFLEELKGQDPETLGYIVRWGRDGSEKFELANEGNSFAAALKVIRDDGRCSIDLAMELVWSALLIGLRTGLKPHEIERLKSEMFRTRQRANAQKQRP